MFFVGLIDRATDLTDSDSLYAFFAAVSQNTLIIAGRAMPPWWVTTLLAIGGLVLIANWVFQRHFSRVIANVFDRDAPFRPRDFEPEPTAQSFDIVVNESITLAASLLEAERGSDADRPLIVFCPEFGGSRWTARFYCAALLDAGCDVLTFDFRNHGDSDHQPGYEPTHWLTQYELEDLRAVLDWLASQDDLSKRLVGIMGMSRGGCAALKIAAERPEIPAVFVEGAYTITSVALLFIGRWQRLHAPFGVLDYVPRWHVVSTFRKAKAIIEQRRGCRFVDLEGKLRSLSKRRLQLVTGKRDSYVPEEIARQVLRETGHSDDSFWLVRGAKHNQSRNVYPEQFDELVLATFLKRSK